MIYSPKDTIDALESLRLIRQRQVGFLSSLSIMIAADTTATASNAGKAILIHSAASSVGSYAVQLAKRAGLFVVATAGAS